MATKDQKSALSASMKAEEAKVATASPAPASVAKKPAPKAKKAPAPAPAKAATKVTAKQPKTKPAAAAKAAKPPTVAAPAKTAKTLKVEKESKREAPQKVVRDSFTMPKDDYAMIAVLKKRATEMGLVARKSELLRAGLKALIALNPTQLKTRLAAVEKIKTGRPNKAKSKKK